MSDQFFGSWKLVSSDNFEAFLKELEVHYVKRKLAFLVVPTVIFTRDDNNVWCMETQTHIKTVRAEFELDKEFDELTIDDRKLKTVFTLESDKHTGQSNLVQTQMNSKGIKAVITRAINTNKENETVMNVTMVCNNVVSSAVFKKLT